MKKLPIDQRGFSPIFLLVGLLVLALVGGLVYYQKQNSNNSKDPNYHSSNALNNTVTLDCSDSKKLADKLTKDIDQRDYYLEFSNDKYFSTEFVTRRASQEPHITYPGRSILLMLRHNKKDITNSLQNNVTKMLEEQSFKQDTLNNGYTKGDIIYRVNINNEWVTFSKFSYADHEVPVYNAKPDQLDAEEVSGLHIKCGIKNEEFDALYDELLPSNEVKERVAQFSPITLGDDSIKTKPESVFGIKKIHKNNVLETSIFGTTGGGGYALWLHKTNNGWEKVYSGQEHPDCNLLEELKVGSGVDCYDKSLKDDSKTK